MSKAEIKRKFDEIVDFAEIEKFLDTPVKRYSSGMYVRLAFAVAGIGNAINKPDPERYSYSPDNSVWCVSSFC
jgi:ABC-type Na+ transport system ATPase subunit NatA